MQPPFKPGDIVILTKPKYPSDLNRVAIVVDCFIDDEDYMVQFKWQHSTTRHHDGTLFARRFRTYSNIRRP